MKKILLYTLMTVAAAGMTACEDFLTRDTYDQIGSDEFWKSETDLELYANGFLQKMIPGDGTITRGDIDADYCAVDIATDLLRPDGNVSPDNQGGWTESSWTNLRRVNYMLDNMHRCRGRVSDEVYNHYEGVARFWRAWFYYDKVRTFGAVPWYDFTISASDKEALTKPRDSREYVMDKVLEDLTFASTYCLADAKYTKGSALINKWVALAFKSRVCLYEGTFRKYHSREPSSDKPWQNDVYNADNKFLREAAAAAKEIMDKGPFSLVTGDVKTAYRSLFTSAGLLTQEVIFGREYSKELSAFHETSWYYYSPTYGTKIAMTKKFMNTYLTTKGTPFTDIDGYKTVDFIHEFDGRDARMAQTVISPSYQMKISGRTVPYSPNWKVTRTGYHPIKWSIDDDADNVLSKAASWNSLPIIRYAEVLLNYAEAKAELGEMDAAVWDQTIAPLRNRAGVTSVIPAKADPYMEAYFLNTVTDKWILEVRRERGIELCLEMGLRWDDDMRWHMGEPADERQQPVDGHLHRQHELYLRLHGSQHRRQRRSRARLLHPSGRGHRTFDRHFEYGRQPDLLAQRRGQHRLGIPARVEREEVPASDSADGDHAQPQSRTERALEVRGQ
jgi:hypothetical protein